MAGSQADATFQPSSRAVALIGIGLRIVVVFVGLCVMQAFL